MSISKVYDSVRALYHSSQSVVPNFRLSGTNLSQASLNKEMLEMLELSPGMSVADLGSGVGLTGLSMAKFGCKVTGQEQLKPSVDIANEQKNKIGLDNIEFKQGATNDIIGNEMFDRMHTGQMLNNDNASQQAQNHLKNGGLAVFNVGNINEGRVYIFKKDSQNKVEKIGTELQVIQQEDVKPQRKNNI